MPRPQSSCSLCGTKNRNLAVAWFVHLTCSLPFAPALMPPLARADAHTQPLMQDTQPPHLPHMPPRQPHLKHRPQKHLWHHPHYPNRPPRQRHALPLRIMAHSRPPQQDHFHRPLLRQRLLLHPPCKPTLMLTCSSPLAPADAHAVAKLNQPAGRRRQGPPRLLLRQKGHGQQGLRHCHLLLEAPPR